MSKQTTNKIIMIEPRGFYANEQTMDTNAHQTKDNVPDYIIQENALAEHQQLVSQLRAHHIDVELFVGEPDMPDDLFCNNWVSFHEGEPFVLYPLLAQNRRKERRKDLIAHFESQKGPAWDLSTYENQGKYLESTGSLVLDRVNRVAYAALSPRTDKSVFLKWAEKMQYEPVAFNWHYADNQPVYHTNVIMFVGTSLIGICPEGIIASKRDEVMDKVSKHHAVLELSYDQINHFCGNAIELRDKQDKRLLVISETAYQALTEPHLKRIFQHVDNILHTDVSTIEKYGGGSVRCMILEKF